MRRDSNSPKLKVLFIHTATYTPLGAGPWVHSLIMRNLDRTEVEVHAAVSPGSDTTPAPLFGILRQTADLEIHRVDLGPESLRDGLARAGRHPIAAVNSLCRALSSFTRLYFVVRRDKIDIIHTDERPRDAFVSVLLGKMTGAKVIVHLHVAFGEWMSPLLRWSLPRADLLLCVSEFVRKSHIHEDRDPARVRTVLNSIDIPQWTPRLNRDEMRRQLQLEPDAPVIITACRLGEGKGVLDLVRAISEVRAASPDVKLIIAGQGDQQFTAQMVDLIGQLDLTGSVTLLGWRSDVPALMAAADIFAMPSRGEPCALAYIESMAMELPVVALNDGGAPEVIQNGTTGLLSDPGDAQTLADNLRSLLIDDGLAVAFGRAGREHVKNHHDGPRLGADVLEVYRDLLSREAL